MERLMREIENRETGSSNRVRKYYLPLYKAAIKGDWKAIQNFLNSNPEALDAAITSFSETILHVAVRQGLSIKIIRHLVERMTENSLEKQDGDGATPLHCAAVVGNTEAAKILCRKNPTLLQSINRFAETPLHCAARFCHRETVVFLLEETYKDQTGFPYADYLGARLLSHLINADFYDIALELLKQYPTFAAEQDFDGGTALLTLARKPQAFESRNKVGFPQRLMYRVIRARRDDALHGGDVENLIDEAETGGKESRLFGIPRNKYDDDSMQSQALDLVRKLSEEAIRSSEADDILQPAILKAAILGNHQLVREIINALPDSVSFSDAWGRNIFHLAILYRREKVFNLLYQMSLDKHFVLKLPDRGGNTILHLAAKLGPENMTLGPALQMQRDLQWFQEVKRIVPPSYQTLINNKGMNPEELFDEEHKEFAKTGQAWMTQVASSYALVASLVTTVVFAAAFTVPGGNNNDGVPNFLNEKAFMIFVVFDGLALFASSISLLMFVSVVSSQDSLRSSPLMLSIGLVTLFFSIASMLVAFSSSLYMVLVHRLSWVAVPICLLTCIPAVIVLVLLYPLVSKIILTTFGPSIFRHKKEEADENWSRTLLEAFGRKKF